MVVGIAVSLEKESPEPVNDSNRRYIIGVDVGSSTLAVVTVFDSQSGKVVRQLYFGRDLAVRQRRCDDRRAKLQSYADKGSEKAKKYLERLKCKQRNFVKTRSGQIVREIVELALKYNASVTVEKLRFRAVKGKINKNGRKKINRIPYAQFREFLESNCLEYGIPFQEIDAYHTFKWCPECGALNNGHDSVNYALYSTPAVSVV